MNEEKLFSLMTVTEEQLASSYWNCIKSNAGRAAGSSRGRFRGAIRHQQRNASNKASNTGGGKLRGAIVFARRFRSSSKRAQGHHKAF